MAMVEFVRETCTKCGTCRAVCDWGLVVLQSDGFPSFFPKADEYCIRCGQCVAVCPTGSVRHQQMPLDQCVSIAVDQGVPFSQTSHLIKSRRSIRVFKDKPVPRELIESVIDVARYAPSGDNFEEVRWLIVDSKETIRKLHGIFSEAARLVTESRIEPWAHVRYADTIQAEFFKRIPRMRALGITLNAIDEPALVVAYAERNNPIAAIDCTIALAYFDLAARGAGLGCCWFGAFPVAAQIYRPLQEAIGLPEGFITYGAMYLGYPKYTYHRIPVRKAARITYFGQ